MPPGCDTNKVIFIKDLLATYKSLPVLWNRTHPDYKNRNIRKESWDILVNKCKEYDEEANIYYTKAEIDKLRCNFRKERRKLLKRRKQGLVERKPTLWYYKLLLFTVDAEDEASDNSVIDEDDIWLRDRVELLMKQLKNYPCLYSPSHPHYRQKTHTDAACKAIADYLTLKSGQEFTATDVLYKVKLVKKMFLTERARMRRQEKINGDGEPRLWCYDLLKFLEENYKQNDQDNEAETPDDNIEDEVLEEITIINDESIGLKMETSSIENSQKPTEDVYDTIGRNVTYKLRQMTAEQRQWAAKILNDVMYHGLMENLTCKSQLILKSS